MAQKVELKSTSKESFIYLNSLDREYDDTEANVKSVEFDLSRYGKYTHTITFSESLTEKKAINEVEKYLSKEIDQEYFDKIKDDLFGGRSFELKDFTYRGDCLGDAKYLEGISIKDGIMTMFIGS